MIPIRIILLFIVLVPACARAAPDLAAPLGAKENPVRSYMPAGEREYLMRLRCPGGAEPAFRRVGSFGTGPYGTIIDGYDVHCLQEDTHAAVFMDMYHRGYREMAAPPGFTVLPELPALAAEGCPPAVPGHAPGGYVFRPLEVRKGPVPLSAIDENPVIGQSGRVYAEFVIDVQGNVDPAQLKFLYLSDDSLRESARAWFLALRFKPAEQRPGCAVPFRAEWGLNFK